MNEGKSVNLRKKKKKGWNNQEYMFKFALNLA